MQIRSLWIVVLAQLVLAKHKSTLRPTRIFREPTIEPTESPRAIITQDVPVRPGRYEEVVGLEIWKPEKCCWCTGTILNNNTVITAGHCLLNATKVNIYINCVQLNICQQIRFGYVFTYPNMRLMGNFIVNDVGAVRTDESLEARRFVTMGEIAPNHLTCTVVGYGRNYEEPHEYRRLYSLKVKNIKPCSDLYPGDIRFHGTLCSFIPSGKEFYRGNSGGPLFCGLSQVGVTSQIIEKYNPQSNRNETVMVWTIPSDSKWIQVVSSANRHSPPIIILKSLLFIFVHEFSF